MFCSDSLVFPAASSPSIKIRISLLPKIFPMALEIEPPILKDIQLIGAGRERIDVSQDEHLAALCLRNTRKLHWLCEVWRRLGASWAAWRSVSLSGAPRRYSVFAVYDAIRSLALF